MKKAKAMSLFEPSPKYYTSTQAQKFAGMAGVLSAAAATGLVAIWMTGDNEDESYLGGVDFEELLFNWHPILMCSGLIFLFSSAIVSFRILPVSKPSQKIIHATCHLLALVCISLGLTAVFVGNNNKDKNAEHTYYGNLSSLHSWLGLGAIVVYGQNYFLGFYHFFVSSVSKSSRQKYMPNHVFLGILAFVMSVLAAETGIMELATEFGCGYEVNHPDTNPAENYKDLTEGCRVANGAGIMILVTMILILYAMLGNNDAVDPSEETAGTSEALIRESKGSHNSYDRF